MLRREALAVLAALAELGPSTSAEIRARARVIYGGPGLGQQEVRSLLYWMKNQKTPLVTMEETRRAGRGHPGIWKITDYGRSYVR